MKENLSFKRTGTYQEDKLIKSRFRMGSEYEAEFQVYKAGRELA